MVARAGPVEQSLVLKFGGGLHTRPGQDDIDASEAADGNNFSLDFQNKQLKNRKPFDKIGTVPNAAAIKGGVSLRKADGTVSFLIQAGNTVYEWDGNVTFTSRGTVSSSARLRGHWNSQYWALGDLAIITDLASAERVMTWDGTTLTHPSFLDEDGGAFGNFFAKYCIVSNERAIFFNEKDATANPHMIVGSKTSDYLTISIANTPSTAIGDDDPFFLLSPDLRGINGAVEAFGTIIISTERGQIFALSGSSASDFAFTPFYAGSAASGDESVAYIGNDVVYGRLGRIESVSDTNRFGDSEFNNIAANVLNVVNVYDAWAIVYNARLNRVYAFPTGGSEVWVCDTSMLGVVSPLTGTVQSSVSPWMRWRTRNALGFQPTFRMSMLDPVDGLEYVFMGDSGGNLYRLEGTGASGDGGTDKIQTEWLSKVFEMPLDAQVYGVEGYVSYVKSDPFTIILTFEYGGEGSISEQMIINVPGTAEAIYYGGDNYYNDVAYFGSPQGKLYRQPFMAPGQDSDFQVRIQVSENVDWAINEIGLRFGAASA